MYDIAIGKYSKDTCSDFFSQENQIDVENLLLCNWEEHCVECSPPYCYNNCENYQKRIDGRCIRMQHGIQIIKDINGINGYGIKCEFRKWAKLETIYTGKFVTTRSNKIIDNINRIVSLLTFGKTSYKLVDGVRRHLYLNTRHSKQIQYDYLYINCYLKDKNNVQLLIQIDNQDRITYTNIINLKQGENAYKLDIPNNIALKSRIFITPLEETNTVIYFRWLDIVRIKPQRNTKSSETFAPKVKVVAWDLDNTLWNGTLINDSNVTINKTALNVIKELDKRGILNTICSKNDEGEAIEKLKELGILDYFLYPAINWGQKSENLKMIAKQLNLGINSFAFIDDNIREREEVANSLPMVRVYDEKVTPHLLSLDEFDVPITETSVKRRLLYKEDIQRNTFKSKFSNNYDDFLRELKMVLIIESITDANKDRCYELLSRSNQLNLSTNRYTRNEYENLLKSPENLCFAFSVRDKFGDYGIVSFISLHINNSCAEVLDFVISCRIAKKKVENAIIRSLKNLLWELGVKSISAKLVITKKNSPLVDVFKELPFSIVDSNTEYIQYYLDNITKITDDGIIEIRNS